MALFIRGINNFTNENDRKKFAVSGCGRSGTLYIARVLQALGSEVGHEGFLRDGISSWYIAEKTRAMAVVEMMKGCDCVFIHIVRRPLDAISSMMRCEMLRTRAALDFFARTNPEYNRVGRVERCARYWVEWNKAAAQNLPTDLRLRIEDVPGRLDELCEVWFGRKVGREAWAKVAAMGNHCHALSKSDRRSLLKCYGEESLRTVSLEECGRVGVEVEKMAKAFGYKL